MGGPERGATLVEVLVTAGLMLVALLAGGSLVVHSVKLERSVMQTANDPAAEQAVALIRRDVHAAAALRTLSPVWTGVELELQMFDGGIVQYTQSNGVLLRSRRNGAGEEMSRRIILRRLDDWLWRSPIGNLLEVKLVLPGHGDPVGLATKAGHQQFGVVELKNTHAVFSLRAPGRRSW